jgi:hypothetical protein
MKLHNNKKRLLKNSLFALLMIVLILALPMFGNTQPAPGGGGEGGNPDATTGGSVPIDGGLSLVLAAGVGYGAKKIRDYNKKKREENEF